MAFWIAIADTRVMPVIIAAQPSPLSKGPSPIANPEPRNNSATFRPSMVRKPGKRLVASAPLIKPNRHDHDAENWKSQELGDGAAGSQHQCRTESHEVAGHMGGEQTVQRKKTGGIDIAAVHAQEYR